jgi:hypothetical protein
VQFEAALARAKMQMEPQQVLDGVEANAPSVFCLSVGWVPSGAGSVQLSSAMLIAMRAAGVFGALTGAGSGDRQIYAAWAKCTAGAPTHAAAKAAGDCEHAQSNAAREALRRCRYHANFFAARLVICALTTKDAVSYSVFMAGIGKATERQRYVMMRVKAGAPCRDCLWHA